MIESMEDATMDSLINAENRSWDTSMIDGIFTPQEASTIKKISLGCRELEDKIVWAMSNDGRYTCKSGYRFLKEETKWDRQEFNQNQDKDLWKGVWGLLTPNKLRNFIWRACRNTLPPKKNLVRRTIITYSTCD